MPRIVCQVNGLLGTAAFDSHSSQYGFSSGWSGVPTWRPAKGANATDIIDELANLLMAGRLSAKNRAIIVNKYIATYADLHKNANKARRLAMQLILSSIAFHTTHTLTTKSGEDRGANQATAVNDGANSAKGATPAGGYRAIIYLDVGGRADSFNMLVPHTCPGTKNTYGKLVNHTLDEQYASIRAGVALDMKVLHQINAGNDTQQPCSVFELHPKLMLLTGLYRDGNALFIANMRYMSNPYWRKTVGWLFGHSSQLEDMTKVNLFDMYGGASVLGRLRDMLNRRGHVTCAISVQGSSVSLLG